MIRRLALAQLRANRAYTAWITLLLTLLVTVLTYILVAGATQASLGRTADAIVGLDLERHGWTDLQVGQVWSSDVENEAEYADSPSPTEVAELIDEARRSGLDALATSSANFYPEGEFPADFTETAEWEFFATALTDPERLAAVVASGRAPIAADEMAVTADAARRLDAGLGDTITVYRTAEGGDGYMTLEPLELTIVGIAAGTDLPGFDRLWATEAYFSWEAVESPEGIFMTRLHGDGQPVAFGHAEIHWDGPSAALDPFFYWGWEPWRGDLALPGSTGPWLAAAAVLFIAMVVMAFAVGRSQAAARTRWVATARTMGATRAYIAGAAAVETLLIAAAAMAAGFVLGVAAAQTHLSIARAIAAPSMAQAAVSLTWWLAPVVLGAVAVVAVAVAAVPAFWASRVAPTAALKPVSDVTESEVSRRVSPTWVVVIFGLGVAALGWGELQGGMSLATWLGGLMCLVSGLALIIETARGVVALVGRRLARSGRPAVMVAGDALAARPRQATAPAVIVAVGITLFAWIAADVARSYVTDFYWPFGQYQPPGIQDEFERVAGEYVSSWWGDVFSSASVLAMVIAAATVQLVAVAMFWSHHTSTAAEGAAQRAMGLTSRDQRRALWIQQVVPQALGAALGLVVSTLGYVGLGLVARIGSVDDRLITTGWSALAGVLAGATLAAIVLGVAALAAAMAARLQVAPSPIVALAPRQ